MRSLAAIALLLLPTSATAQIHLKAKHYVANEPPGYCGWTSLDVLARYHGIEPLIGIGDHYKKQRWFDGRRWHRYDVGATVDSLEDQCRGLGVRCRVQYEGDHRLGLLRRARQVGGIIGVRHWETDGQHAVVLTDYTDEHVYFFDTNDCEHYRMDWPQFHERWTGFVVLIEP